MTRFLPRLIVALALFAALVALRIHTHYPTLPNPLAVSLVLEAGEAGRADPLIVGGRVYAGDFLSVRFIDEQTVEFVYDSWAYPGIPSKPVKIKPGEPLQLEIAMPALHQVRGNLGHGSGQVRVDCNGVTVLDATAHYYVRQADELFFGENALGGTACGPTLRGKIVAPSGRILRGGPENHSTHPERLRDWLQHYPRQLTALLLLSAGLAIFGGRLRNIGPAFHAALRLGVSHWRFVLPATIASIFYAWLVTLHSFQFLHGEVFGSFYDYQAESFLQVRLDVPEDAIGGEAFEARGKLYGYFGPTPAILRLPFTVSGFAFGKLSRAFMLGYFVSALLAAYLILCHALRILRSDAARSLPAVPSLFSTLVLVGSAGLGSTIFFLGSRGLIFHEAILGGITFALWSCWCALRHLAEPNRRWWIGALACGVLSIHTRPPTGLFALILLGCITLVIAYREWRANRWTIPPSFRRHFGIGMLCVVGFLSLNALAWLKFRSFDAAPLRISRPYAEPGRLERIDGKSFHLVNVPYNFDAYVLRPNFRFERTFPWIFLVSKAPRRDFPHAKIDLPDHTLALPYAMPSLFLLATLGCLGAALALPSTRAPIALLWIAVLPMSLALFAAIATAQRYTGDFCPFLITAAMFGLAAIECLPSRWRFLAQSLTGLATAIAMAVTVAITLHYQGDTLWGVPEQTRQNYQQLRRTFDGLFSRAPAPDR